MSLALLDFGGGLGWLSAGAGSHDNCTLVARQLTNKTQYLALVCVALLSLHWSLPEATLWRRRRAKQGASTSRKAASSEPPLLSSAGTLLWIYRRLIGRSYIALARQDQRYRKILDPLGRLLIILVFVAELEHKLWAILNFQAGNFPVVITLVIRKRA